MLGTQRFYLGVVAAALAATAGGCSHDIISTVGSANLLPSVREFSRPDWLTYSGGKDDFTLRAVQPDDLVSQDGQCAVSAQDAAAATAAVAAQVNPERGAGAPRESSPEPQEIPLLQGGIALQMTECEVVRRAGAPERLEFGTSAGGERVVTITYIQGNRPGVYHFSGGRLKSIERAPEPAPSKAKAKPAKKRA